MSTADKSSCIIASIIMGQRPGKISKETYSQTHCEAVYRDFMKDEDKIHGRIWAITVNFRLMEPCGEWAVDSTFAVSKDFV